MTPREELKIRKAARNGDQRAELEVRRMVAKGSATAEIQDEPPPVSVDQPVVSERPQADTFANTVKQQDTSKGVRGLSMVRGPSDGQSRGIMELAAAAGTSAVARPIAGLAGIAEGLNPFSPPGSAADTVKTITDLITYKPGEAGAGVVSGIKSRLDQVGSDIPGPLKAAAKTVGSAIKGSPDAVAEQFGPIAGAIAKSLPHAMESVAGFKAATMAAGSVAVGTGDDVGRAVFKAKTPAKEKIAQLIADGTPDGSTAKFKIKPTPVGKAMAVGGPRVVRDASAISAIKQGFDPGVVAVIKGSSRETRAKMLQMSNLLARGKNDAKFAVSNRPTDIAGRSLMDRVRVIQSANQTAAKQLDGVALALKGQAADPSVPINSFLRSLAGMGIKVERADLKPIFSGSTIEGVTGAEQVITKIMKRLRETKAPDAHDLHRLKQFIDEQVSFGARTEGLSGKTENILKTLRRDLDQTLDSKFPEYNRVNTQFSETKAVLDSVQDIAGKKMDLSSPSADSATGTLLRRLMSNAQSRVRLLDSVHDIEAMARKHATKPIKDDLITQVLFADELDSVFGPVARTSFQGQIEQGVKQAGNAVQSSGGLGGLVIDLAAKGAAKAQGINEAGAMKSIRDLLRDSSSFASKK